MKKTFSIVFLIIAMLCLAVGCSQPEKTLESISITKLPKTSYVVGQKLDLTGLVVKANYSDTSSVQVVDYTTNPAKDTELTTAGTIPVTVTYKEKTAEFSVTVVEKEATGIVIKTVPSKKLYSLNDTVDTTGMVVTVSYNDGTSEDVTSGFTTPPFSVSPEKLTQEGEQDITVSYKGKSATFTATFKVTVTEYFTVTFDSQGGSPVDSQDVAKGASATRPADPTRDGYEFENWFLSKEGTGDAYTFTEAVTENTTLYAKWSLVERTTKWCLLSYFDFTNLSESALFNLDEICQVKPTDNARVYILTGGASKTPVIYDSLTYLKNAIDPLNPSDPFAPSAKPDTYQLWEYTSDGRLKELPYTLKGMNDPDVLKTYIETVMALAKQEDPYADFRYILDLWNHGGGSYAGLIGDEAIQAETNEETYMPLSGLGKSLKEVTSENGFRFDVVIFDMCLMQSIESMHTVSADTADYVIGSQTSSAALGTAYTDWISYLYNNPGASGLDFGREFCDKAYEKLCNTQDPTFREKRWRNNLTWSVVDTSKLSALETAYEAYVASDLANRPVADIEKCLSDIDKLPAFNPDASAAFWSLYMYDISVFTSHVGLSEPRTRLLSAINDAVVYKKNGEVQENAGCCGLSMCILTDNAGWKAKWKYSSEWNLNYLNNCLTDNYRAFQKRITAIP